MQLILCNCRCAAGAVDVAEGAVALLAPDAPLQVSSSGGVPVSQGRNASHSLARSVALRLRARYGPEG